MNNKIEPESVMWNFNKPEIVRNENGFIVNPNPDQDYDHTIDNVNIEDDAIRIPNYSDGYEFCVAPPLIRILNYSDGWELATKSVFQIWSMHIEIPEGFKTDFATIPQMFQNLIKVNGKHRLAALLHDYLYSIRGQLPNRTLTRKQCDLAFLQGMKQSNVKWLKRMVMYRMVRMFGGTYWAGKK